VTAAYRLKQRGNFGHSFKTPLSLIVFAICILKSEY
jgi:hypothetical protein